MLKLVVLNGDMQGVEVPLDSEELSLGRRSDNDVCLSLDMKVSRRHARILRAGDGLMLEDLGSANGTFLRQRRIYEPTPVGPGDRFRLGRTWLEMAAMPDATAAGGAAERVVLVGEDQAAEGAGPSADPAGIVFALDAARPQPPPEDAVEAQRRLAVMLEFGRSLALILDLPRLLRKALDRIMDVIPAEQASILLLDAQTSEVVPRVARSRGGEVDQDELRISRHMVTQALEQRLAVLTSDATTDARFQEADSVQDLRIRSAICAPMIARGTAAGVVYLDTSSRTHVFTEQDVHLVAGIAAQLAIAIENARLYSDLRDAYENLQAAQEQLVRSERVATVGTLAAGIAHDMANIVSPIKPLIEMLLAGHEMDAQARDVLRRQTERLVTLVQRLLAFARTSTLSLVPTDLNQAVRDTLALVGTELTHRGVKVTLALDDDLPPARADAPQVERALLNLILNAADALQAAPDKEIEIRTEAEEDEVLVSVRDTGPGIPLDVQEKLFEPFFTTKESGTGLGLYSCRRIVEEEHGGSLEVDSREGGGTTITIRLPATAA